MRQKHCSANAEEFATERYTNLEDSYLLQSLEALDGVVVLTSNLRNQIDAAFLRRFGVYTHFARPTA
jgi:hypothetical protein